RADQYVLRADIPVHEGERAFPAGGTSCQRMQSRCQVLMLAGDRAQVRLDANGFEYLSGGKCLFHAFPPSGDRVNPPETSADRLRRMDIDISVPKLMLPQGMAGGFQILHCKEPAPCIHAEHLR